MTPRGDSAGSYGITTRQNHTSSSSRDVGQLVGHLVWIQGIVEVRVLSSRPSVSPEVMSHEHRCLKSSREVMNPKENMRVEDGRPIEWEERSVSLDHTRPCWHSAIGRCRKLKISKCVGSSPTANTMGRPLGGGRSPKASWLSSILRRPANTLS